MTEILETSTTQHLRKKSMDAKAAAKEARLKAALRRNLKRRKEGIQSPESDTD